MITTILFDLDGTLLPMDQDVFLKAYMGGLAAKMAPHGYEPNALVKNVWAGTAAMVKNDGSQSNEKAFWNFFTSVYGKDSLNDMALFEEFYHNEFQNFQNVCGFNPQAAETVKALKAMGYRVALATNPLFPAIATQSRTRWAGLNPDDFELITTYENSCHCKPNPEYYRDVLATLNLKAEECLMVGNDAYEDTVPAALGIKVFLLTDCIINKNNMDISAYPHGSYPELLKFIREL